MTYDTKGIWRCYEIKVSLSDFKSKAKKTFCGHFNYFVMPRELFDKVQDEIPAHIGVYVNGTCVKKAKKQELLVDEKVLKDSMIRSLSREADKLIQSSTPPVVMTIRKQLSAARKEADNYRRKYRELMKIGRAKYGRNWYSK
ncbi:hypothetical protein ABWK22_02255 [Gottfriedia acidiceleris]|uniref:hypothetical protein n=1 Tax=Gottfriedia acidiceleris TaxID=371036 RepID=UPI0033970DD8